MLRIADTGRPTLVDIRQDTTLCDCDVSEKFVQFLVVSDSKLKMPGNDASLLVVAGSVTS